MLKKIVLSALFIIVVLITSDKITDIIKFKQFSNTSKGIFYNENIDYDVIFLGASTVHFGISPLYLFDKYGLSSYNLSVPGCQYDELFAITQDAINNKKTKLFVVEYKALLVPGKNRVFSIGNISSIKNPISRFQSYYKDDDNFTKSLQDTNLYYIFHDRWKQINEYDFFTNGYLRGYSSSAVAKKQQLGSSSTSFQLTDIQKKQIDEYIALLRKNSIKLILVSIPNINNHDYFSDAAMNATKDYVSKYNVEFIDLTDLSIFDLNRDFESFPHLTFQGGKKLMNRQDFIPYIMEKYNLQDHRNDKKYVQWHKDYEKQERMINREECRVIKDVKSWWEYSHYDNYTMFISINGDDVLNRLSQDMKDKFKSFGLNKFETDKKNQKYAAIIDNNQVFFEEVTDNIVSYNGRMKNIVNLMVSSEPWKATINVSGKPRAKNRYGINFVIYDKVNREIVDSIWIDPAQPDVVRR